MKPNNSFREYARIMNCICIDSSVKQQIIRNCARYSTLKKIKAGKYKIIAVKKESRVEKF